MPLTNNQVPPIDASSTVGLQDFHYESYLSELRNIVEAAGRIDTRLGSTTMGTSS